MSRSGVGVFPIVNDYSKPLPLQGLYAKEGLTTLRKLGVMYHDSRSRPPSGPL